ncbi:MAG: RsmE family RNA methyltransferase [Candidatus Peribacteria bacterium]|nr:MAG: RsmE family RNA methyltransferase [Candidatus Peribacteria bacterium]
MQQIGRVLRMQVGEQIVVQYADAQHAQRRTVQLAQASKTVIVADILDCKTNVKKLLNTMYIAYPNKLSKAELIVQKLSELGISNIIFWPAQRSQLRDYSEKKLERMQLIAIEATEQSHGRWVPEIVFADSLPDV